MNTERDEHDEHSLELNRRIGNVRARIDFNDGEIITNRAQCCKVKPEMTLQKKVLEDS